MEIKFTKLNENAVSPQRATDEAAGYDLSAVVEQSELFLSPQESKMISTGIAVEIPRGYVGLLFGRSGLGCKENLRLANCVGVIDSDYRGEIKVCLYNDSSTKTNVIKNGTRIAQLVIVPHLSVEMVEVEELSNTVRGEGGFGSTGQ